MQSHLLNAIISDHYLKNDAELARKLDKPAPVISKWRSGRVPIGATGILGIHEKLGMPVAEIRRLIEIDGETSEPSRGRIVHRCAA